MTKNNRVVADFVVEDIKPKFEAMYFPIWPPGENVTSENPNQEASGEDNLRRKNNEVEERYGK